MSVAVLKRLIEMQVPLIRVGERWYVPAEYVAEQTESEIAETVTELKSFIEQNREPR